MRAMLQKEMVRSTEPRSVACVHAWTHSVFSAGAGYCIYMPCYCEIHTWYAREYSGQIGERLASRLADGSTHLVNCQRGVRWSDRIWCRDEGRVFALRGDCERR